MELDFACLCRACKMKSDNMVSIYHIEDYHNLTPAEMLMACTSLKVSAEDGMPTSLCHGCLKQLKSAFTFKKQCEDTDFFLREYVLIKQLVKTEPISVSDTTIVQSLSETPPAGKLDVDDSIKLEPPDERPSRETEFLKLGLPVKRKRGRPRKLSNRILDGIEKSINSVNAIENQLLLSTNTNMVRSQRGRPRKCINYGKDLFDTLTDIFPTKSTHQQSASALKSNEPNGSDFDDNSNDDFINSTNMSDGNDADDDTNDLFGKKRCSGKTKTAKNNKSEKIRLMPRSVMNEENPFSCEICAEKFPRRDHLIAHTKNHLKELNHNCDVCGKKLETIEKLAKHKFSHHNKPAKPKTKTKDQTKYSCTVCEKSFTSEKHRHNHTYLAHDKIHTCESCKATFKGRDALHKHKTRSNECSSQYLCPDCGRRFAIFTTFKVHLQRHRGEKPYKCQYCSKGFPRQCDVRLHETRHRGERNHLCTICGRGFNRRYMLTIHVRTHTGERPYKCTFCEAAFTQRNDMVTHVRRHTGERFSCELCPEEFLAHYLLSKHKRKAHNIDIPPAKPILERIEVPKIVDKPPSETAKINTT